MFDLKDFFSNEYNDRIAKEFGDHFEKLTFIEDLPDLLSIVSQACGFAREFGRTTLNTYTAAAYLERSLVISEQVSNAVEVLDRFPVEDSINLLQAIVGAMAYHKLKFNLARISQ